MATLNTFPSSPAPDFPSQRTPEFSTRETNFGDGYNVEVPNGINNRTDKVTLSWTQLNADERDVIMDFLEAHAPTTPFWFVFPGDATQKAYKCKTFSDSQTNGGYYAISATLTQVHNH